MQTRYPAPGKAIHTMKLTKIDVQAWNSPDGHQTYLSRYYDNPGRENIVLLNPDKVTTSLYKGNTHQPIKPGIHHFTRP